MELEYVAYPFNSYVYVAMHILLLLLFSFCLITLLFTKQKLKKLTGNEVTETISLLVDCELFSSKKFFQNKIRFVKICISEDNPHYCTLQKLEYDFHTL